MEKFLSYGSSDISFPIGIEIHVISLPMVNSYNIPILWTKGGLIHIEKDSHQFKTWYKYRLGWFITGLSFHQISHVAAFHQISQVCSEIEEVSNCMMQQDTANKREEPFNWLQWWRLMVQISERLQRDQWMDSQVWCIYRQTDQQRIHGLKTWSHLLVQPSQLLKNLLSYWFWWVSPVGYGPKNLMSRLSEK